MPKFRIDQTYLFHDHRGVVEFPASAKQQMVIDLPEDVLPSRYWVPMDEPARAALIAVWEADAKRFEEHENKAGVGRAKDAIAKLKTIPLGHAPGSRRPPSIMSPESRLGIAHDGAKPEPRSAPKVVPAGEEGSSPPAEVGEDGHKVKVKRAAQ